MSEKSQEIKINYADIRKNLFHTSSKININVLHSAFGSCFGEIARFTVTAD